MHTTYYILHTTYSILHTLYSLTYLLTSHLLLSYSLTYCDKQKKSPDYISVIRT